MLIHSDTLTGLQMIRDRYWFGMFTGCQDMDIETETEEYMMRDALFAIVKHLESQIPSLYDEIEKEKEID